MELYITKHTLKKMRTCVTENIIDFMISICTEIVPQNGTCIKTAVRYFIVI
jgi:hypothetical protein